MGKGGNAVNLGPINHHRDLSREGHLVGPYYGKPFMSRTTDVCGFTCTVTAERAGHMDTSTFDAHSARIFDNLYLIAKGLPIIRRAGA